MNKSTISGGTIHSLPDDLCSSLLDSRRASKLWENITPPARNEFICWVENAKQTETRARRISRTCQELNEGKRRPCCWPGCPHHNPATAKFLLKRVSKN